jgi:hypothetical protein
MNPVLVGAILVVLWLFLPTRTQMGCQRRTSKLTILFRLVAIPFAVVGFWGVMFLIADVGLAFSVVLGGVIAVLVGIGWCWGLTNLGTFLSNPREYRLWKRGGGDPWFDTLDPPLNNDPDSVRYQEVYRERDRQELEELFPPSAAPDPTRGIDDPNVL